MTGFPDVRADILGKLLLIQETLDVLPDTAGIAGFLRRSLREVPGVSDGHLWVEGKVLPPSTEYGDACATCEEAWKMSGVCPEYTVGDARVICFPLRTARQLHGMLVLSLGDEQAFSPYRPFVRNIANVVATTFDTREHLRQLDEAKAVLETQVAERTATLKESEEKFRALVETTSDWAWEVDAAGTFTYASPMIEALLGFKPDEVVGKTPFDFMPPEEAQRRATEFLAASRAARPLKQVLNTNLHKDGHEVEMETSGIPIFDALGNVAGYRGINRDVTARQRTMEALRDSENKFRLLSACAPDAIIMLNQDGQITDWNASAEGIFGHPAAEVVGRDLHMLLVPARQRSAARKGLEEFRESGTGPVINKTLEITALRRGGTEFPAELSISSLRLHGHWHAIGIVRDISERKRAEQTALEQFKLTEAFFNHSVSALVILDRDFNFVRVNEAYARSARLDISEFAGRNHFDMYPSDAKPIFEDVVRNKRPFATFNRAFVYPDQPARGVTYWDWTLMPILDAQGEVEYLVFSLVEVTERTRAESAVRESEQNYRSLADSAPALIWSSGPDKLCNYFNQPWLKFTGRTLEQELGNGWTDGIHPDDCAPRLATYVGAFDRRESVSMEYRLRRHDGQFRWIREDGCARYDSSGEFTGYLGYALDITERKRAEEAFGKSARDLKEAQRLARIGSWDWDTTTDTITWSEEYYHIFGIDPTQPLPGYEDLLRAYTPESAARLEAAVKRNLQTGESYELDLELTSTEGPQRWITARSETKRDAHGQIIGLRGTAQDITERKRLQTQFLQAQKLESVGQLAGGVAHDFNNMLTAILGYTELTLLKLGAGHAVAPHIEEIRKAAQRSANLTRQLLAFARKETIAPKVLDLNESVEGILKMLRRVIGENVTLVWTPGSAPWNVKADAAQIDQVLANLAVNARDAMTGCDARLEIATSNVVLDASIVASHPGGAQGEFVLLTVTDNGCGMDAHTLAHIFEPFFTTKAPGEGTGLGMFTVYGIAKQHNGFIDIKSTLGVGTTVQLYLPRTAEAAESSDAGPVQAMRGGAETILLVDDEELVRTPVAEMLRHLGYQVLLASSGAEATALVASHAGKIDLLLTDVIMFGVNGVQLRDKLLGVLPDLKVLFMSGYAGDTISRLGVLDAGMGFIQKPITFRILAEAVRRSFEEKTGYLNEPAVSAG